MSQWLLERLFETENQPTPRFAFQGTINWIRALAQIINSELYNDKILKDLFANLQRRAINKNADTLVFENMLMAHHNLASLYSINDNVIHQYDTCRSAIISWYYAIYFSSSAMIAAKSGSAQETHSTTAKVWQSDIVNGKLLPYPFNLCVSSLITKEVNKEIKAYKGSNSFDLNTYSQNNDQAHGAILSYLKGTADYKKWEAEEKIKLLSDFKKLGALNFRSKAAREYRDNILRKNQVNFLIQAFRFRGKANYRDSIFLSYGNNNEEKIKQFTKDLFDVANAFVRVAAFFSSKRVETGTWNLFIKDIETNTRVSINADIMKI